MKWSEVEMTEQGISMDSGSEDDFNCCDRSSLFRILFVGPDTISKPASECIIILRFNENLDLSILCQRF